MSDNEMGYLPTPVKIRIYWCRGGGQVIVRDRGTCRVRSGSRSRSISRSRLNARSISRLKARLFKELYTKPDIYIEVDAYSKR